MGYGFKGGNEAFILFLILILLVFSYPYMGSYYAADK